MSSQFRGLRHFVGEIRAAISYDDELQRINEEKQKIRNKFSASNLSVYDLKKYTLKMFYMGILGHKVDFGLVPVSQLMASKDKESKLIGYLTMQQLLRDQPDFLRMVTQTVLHDLSQSDSAFHMCLALDFIANTADASMAEIVAQPILTIIEDGNNNSIPTVVRKKATLALLQLYLINTEAVENSGVQNQLVKLVEVRNVGFLNCLMHLMDNIAKTNPEAVECVKHRCIYLMTKVLLKREVSEDHIYYQVPCPWLIISLVKMLMKLNCTLGIGSHNNQQQDQKQMIEAVIERVFSDTAKTGVSGLQSKVNIHWAICVEMANLAAFYRNLLTFNINIQFLIDVVKSNSTASNIKYAALISLERLSLIPQIQSQLVASIQDLAGSILTETDFSVRQRGVILLCNCQNSENSAAVVAALIFCAKCDAPENYKEDAILRSVRICQKEWKVEFVVNSLLKLIVAGNGLKINIWHDFIEIVERKIREQHCGLEVLNEVFQACFSAGQFTSDKTLLTCFCYIFKMLFKEVVDKNNYIMLVKHSLVSLQAKETENQFGIAIDAFMLLVAAGDVPLEELVWYCGSEFANVQQSVCEGYVLIAGGQQELLATLMCGEEVVGGVNSVNAGIKLNGEKKIEEKMEEKEPVKVAQSVNLLDDLF
ncbi:Alpha adaptin [Spironucleus salmonicida]|uniref:Alpha adaptin n=1 Tax=Spironucleus salmonicida TaxID=348837 RepID=V6LTJ7_9EUKA|nr:Alpha adaptin [Spironucleus salmonicida]|eukprot:EST44114.1 Alpha adaptin [Spironucleus salmonicida]